MSTTTAQLTVENTVVYYRYGCRDISTPLYITLSLGKVFWYPFAFG